MLSLQQANFACRLQERMDNHHANIFALALPHEGTPLDWEAILTFKKYAVEHELTDALEFLDASIKPSPIVCQLSGQSPLEVLLCG